MCGAFGEYVCRREHVCLRAENMYFSCAVDAAWYVHQTFHGPFFGGLCTILTCKPRTLQKSLLGGIFGGGKHSQKSFPQPRRRRGKNLRRLHRSDAAQVEYVLRRRLRRRSSEYVSIVPGTCAPFP